MLDLPVWLWAVIIAGALAFGYFAVRNFLGDLKDLVHSGKDIMESGSKLGQSFNNLKALRTYSSKTEALIEKISASEDGQFVMNSGVLSQEEIGTLSRLQLANFLANTSTMVEHFGKEAFVESMPEFRKGILKSLPKVKSH